MSDIENPVVLTTQGRVMGKTKARRSALLRDSLRCTARWRASVSSAPACRLVG